MATATLLTLDEFLALPDTEPASEFACGKVHQKPMPDNAHAAIQWFLVEILGPFLRRTRAGHGRTEWRCIFGPPRRKRAYIPDLVFVSNDRMPKGNALRRRYLRVAPDLAVEILSPNQAMGRFVDKIQFYLTYGVRLVWVIDPRARTVTVLAPGEEAVVLGAGDALDGGEVLPGFNVALDDIFAQLQV